MDPTSNSESEAISSVHERDAEHTWSETLSEETYCDDQLNVSGNSCDCTGYFEMPECVMDIYLLALDGGDDSNAALRQISDVYGPHDDGKEVDSNCNHNINPEPYPNEGGGCTGSYNGGAGGGSVYCGGEQCGSCERDFTDKKRDTLYCGCQDDTYQKGLVNKKPDFNDKYVPVFKGASSQISSSSQQSDILSKKTTCDYEDDTYQQPLVNKKPEDPEKYVPVIPPSEPYCRSGDNSFCVSCNGHPDSYELVRNTDAHRYMGGSPDRSNFYADDLCECQRGDESCNNNLKLPHCEISQNCAQANKSAHCLFPTESSYCFLNNENTESYLNWKCDISQTIAVYSSHRCNQVCDPSIWNDLITSDYLACDGTYNACL